MINQYITNSVEMPDPPFLCHRHNIWVEFAYRDELFRPVRDEIPVLQFVATHIRSLQDQFSRNSIRTANSFGSNYRPAS